MTRLDELMAPYPGNAPEWAENERIRDAIREAYRIGHDDGRHARIPQGESTFIDKLRENQSAKKS